MGKSVVDQMYNSKSSKSKNTNRGYCAHNKTPTASLPVNKRVRVVSLYVFSNVEFKLCVENRTRNCFLKAEIARMQNRPQSKKFQNCFLSK